MYSSYEAALIPYFNVIILGMHSKPQEFPGNLLASTYPSPVLPNELLARSEVQRRGKYFEKLEDLVPYGRARLIVQLTKDCLHNAPSQRPTAEQLVTMLGGMREDDNDIITTNRADVVTQTMIFWKQDTETKEKHEKVTANYSEKKETLNRVEQKPKFIQHTQKKNKDQIFGKKRK